VATTENSVTEGLIREKQEEVAAAARASSPSGQQSSGRDSKESSETLSSLEMGRKWLYRFNGDSEATIWDQPQANARSIAHSKTQWWRYLPPNGMSKLIRKEPGANADETVPRRFLENRELFKTDTDETHQGVLYMHLFNGSGWVNEVGSDKQVLCRKATSLRKDEVFKVSEVRPGWLKLADDRGWLLTEQNGLIRMHELQPLLVVFGPESSQKLELIEELLHIFPGKLEVCMPITNRSQRPGEDQSSYRFDTDFDLETLLEGVEEEEEEWYKYGTSVASVEEVQQRNKICILNISAFGCDQLKQKQLVEGVKLIFVNNQDRNTDCDRRVGGIADFKADSSNIKKAAQSLADAMRGWYYSLM